MNKFLFFDFYRLIKGVDINETLKVSLWLDGDDYLMPCHFTKVLANKDEYYSITVNTLDPDNFISCKHLDKNFYFGHPGKIIGKGVLKEKRVSR